MDTQIQFLIDRLLEKGIDLSHIPDFTRDLIITLSENPRMSLESLDKRLQSSGWDGFRLDDETFQLILAVCDPGPVSEAP